MGLSPSVESWVSSLEVSAEHPGGVEFIEMPRTWSASLRLVYRLCPGSSMQGCCVLVDAAHMFFKAASSVVGLSAN